MSVLQEIEASIQTLPAQDFFALADWMTEQHLKVLIGTDFEDPELEAALLKSLDGPRREVNDALFADIRARAGR